MKVQDVSFFHKKCTACGACFAACAKKAIAFTQDSEGFFYPSIDSIKCIHCGLCAKVCPITHEKNMALCLDVLRGKASKDTIRQNSSSGGLFYVFSQYVLKQNGIVFGVAFDSNTQKAVYCNSDNTSIEKLMRSKYVEAADNENVLLQAKSQLEKGRLVLFSGTPCKIVGLKAFLGKDYPNLFTIDFMCHGKPTSKLLTDTINREEAIVGDRCVDVTFREKIKGWRKQTIAFYFEHSERTVYESTQYYYYYYFLHSCSLRKSCFTCSYYNRHEADVTLADYWKLPKETDDDKGHSLVFVNSEKGKWLIGEVSSEIETVSDRSAVPSMEMYAHTHRKGYHVRRRKWFFKKYKEYGVDYIATKGYNKRVSADLRVQMMINKLLRIRMLINK